MGSGNTWTRGLLEKATGICTGSIFCDPALRINGFIGESVRDGSVLVVKTHLPHYQWKDFKVKRRISKNPLYSSGILLIRNPFDAIVAEGNRRRTKSHTDHVNTSYFGNNRWWNGLVHSLSIRWRKTLVNWLGSAHQLNIPLLVVRYEDLKEDQVEQVARMLDFLQQEYNRTELAARLEVGYDDFHRKHETEDNFDPYSEKQRMDIKSIIASTAETLSSMGIDHESLKLKDYT